MNLRTRSSIAIAIVWLLAPFAGAHASSYSGTLTIDCSGFRDFASNVHFDRDNTGSGLEAYQYIATDGAGTQIYTLTNQLPLGDYVLGSAPFSPLPAINPITVRLTSLAGNGLSEQTIFELQGSCSTASWLPSVPALSISGLVALTGLLAVMAVLVLRRRLL